MKTKAEATQPLCVSGDNMAKAPKSNYIADPMAKMVTKPGLGAPKTSTPKNSGPGRNMTGPVSQTTKKN